MRKGGQVLWIRWRSWGFVGYLVVLVEVLQRLSHNTPSSVSFRVERVNDNLFGAFNLRTAKRAALALRFLQNKINTSVLNLDLRP